MKDKSLAQVAFEAWLAKISQGTSYETLSTWETLPERSRDAWRAAVKALVDRIGVWPPPLREIDCSVYSEFDDDSY